MLFISARGGSPTVKKTTAAGFLFNYLIDTPSPIPPINNNAGTKDAQKPRSVFRQLQKNTMQK
jgi:hypothetical protein